MARWLRYIIERFPPVTYVILIGGFCLTGAVAHGTLPRFETPLAFSFFAITLFFFVLRLMDELKDYEKDLVAHPKRPLPRGLLKTTEVRHLIVTLTALMAVTGALIALILDNTIPGTAEERGIYAHRQDLDS